jgi:hypothetical protein
MYSLRIAASISTSLSLMTMLVVLGPVTLIGLPPAGSGVGDSREFESLRV